MEKTSVIPKSKTRSKIKPLEEKIKTLEYEKQCMIEEMYEKGIYQRPTIMSKIEAKEKETLNHIQWYLKECEKVTGRKIPENKIYSVLSALDIY